MRFWPKAAVQRFNFPPLANKIQCTAAPINHAGRCSIHGGGEGANGVFSAR
ncbi:hypothetical protein C8N36_104118 [Pelagimonas varians]|uniref:Uncharacterized protein n=1 Tax=Pelagimonas varians TaxID=696760 RepID=A0A238K9V8_9RHOB|nr:hypothetical protein C8N36_104118 [Pelagimonas varians]SMX38756.1 hypothetical protein PEV8663_01526 [Pelagimonas varians]